MLKSNYIRSFGLNVCTVNSGLKTWVICIYVSTFALISPVGVAIGILLIETLESEASAQGSLVVILQGLAAGTLLYVVFFEVIEKERVKGTNGLVQVRRLIQMVFIVHKPTNRVDRQLCSSQRPTKDLLGTRSGRFLVKDTTLQVTRRFLAGPL